MAVVIICPDCKTQNPLGGNQSCKGCGRPLRSIEPTILAEGEVPFAPSRPQAGGAQAQPPKTDAKQESHAAPSETGKLRFTCRSCGIVRELAESVPICPNCGEPTASYDFQLLENRKAATAAGQNAEPAARQNAAPAPGPAADPTPPQQHEQLRLEGRNACAGHELLFGPEASPVVVGRNAEGADFLTDVGIGRRTFRLVFQNGQWMIYALPTACVTQLNYAQVQEDIPQVLRNADIITLGKDDVTPEFVVRL